MSSLKRNFVTVAALICAVLLGALFAGTAPEEITTEVSQPILSDRVEPPELLLPECRDGESTVVASNKTTVFTHLFYGTANHASVGSVGLELENFFYSVLKVDLLSEKYPTSAPQTNVVIYGRTDNALSTRLADAVDALPASSQAWGIAFENGVLALYANTKVAFDEPNDLFPDVLFALGSYVTDGTLTLPNDLFFVYEVTASEYDLLLEQKAEDDRIEAERLRQEKIEALKNAIASEFSDKDFDPNGEGITEDMEAASRVSYDDPKVYPTKGEHPRVIFTASEIPAIIESLEKQENLYHLNRLMKLVEAETDGKLPPAKEVTSGRRGFHNYDTGMLGVIQAKAFYYALYGDELYGYQAVYAIMNYIKTLDLKYIYSDQTREFGYVMYIAACVYDWCYDLLTENDKNRISLGIEHLICTGKTEMAELAAAGGVKMEVGFPPTGQGPVTGHGSERQLLRDYLAYSIAVYDELPLWYDFIAGRIYEQYVPVREVYYSAGLYPQGTTVYLSGRFFSDMACTLLIYGFSGESPFSENQTDVIVSWAAHITTGLSYFPTGDGTYNGTSNISRLLAHNALIAAYVYDDTLCYNIAQNMNMSCYTGNGALCDVTLPEFLVMNVKDDFEIYENTKEQIPKIVYNGGYLGQYITRNSWADDAAITFVKANIRTTANHDHDDSGTFQIYYKGLLTGDTGVYGSYGSDHFNYYHQATVSHNGLLIANPSKMSGYYSGSQTTVSETGSLSGWMGSNYERAEVKGKSHGYAQNGDPVYSYLSADITKSYTSDQASYVGRTTLTAYTDNEDFPMVFFVLDRIDAVKEDRIKKFLLQVPGVNAPEIDRKNNRVTLVRDEGKLVLTSLLGADKIEGIGGGTGKNFLINGKQCAAADEVSDSWGRVEISTSGSVSDVLLNVIYVTDKSNNETLTPVRVSGTNDTGDTLLEGASIAGITAMFSTQTDSIASTVKFTSEGEGFTTYYVGGLFEGTWKVSAGGAYLGTVYSTHESGMVSFKAPAGVEIKLAPGDDIQPTGGEKITYITGGGDVDKKADKFYFPGTPLTLTTKVTRGNDIFEGWYLEHDYKTKLEEIPADMTGPVILYAKWATVFADEDYSETVINHVDKMSGTSVGGLEYSQSDGATVTYKTEKNGDDGYLFWEVSGQGPSIFVKHNNPTIGSMSGSQITYVFELASGGTSNDMKAHFRVRADKVGDSYAQEIVLFSIGNGVIASAGEEIAKLGAGFVTVAVVLDFETGVMSAYSSKSFEVATTTFDTSKKSLFNREILSARAFSAGALKIGAIKIYEGDRGAAVLGSDLADNYIEFPPEALVDESVDIEFFPNEKTPIPTEGISAFIDGRYKKVAGWYSDEALTNPVTNVPDGVTEKFTVYAKWVDDDYIYYPEETELEPQRYTVGDKLPTGLKITIGGVKVPLIDWYSNENLTGKPITTVPEGTTGAFDVYAKWEEPSVISYPSSVKLPSGFSSIYVAGETKLIEDPEYSGNQNASFGGWYLDAALTTPLVDGIVPAGTVGVFQVYAKWTIVVFESKIEAKASNQNNITGSGFNAKTDDGTISPIFSTIENGDEDYIHVVMDNPKGGPTLTASAPNVYQSFEEGDAQIVTYQMKIGGYDPEAAANVTLRMRIGGTSPTTMLTVKSDGGKMQILDRNNTVIWESSSGLGDIGFVVDFELREVRYYVDGVYKTTASWNYGIDGTTTFCQMRFNSAGALDLSYLKISLGDLYS